MGMLRRHFVFAIPISNYFGTTNINPNDGRPERD